MDARSVVQIARARGRSRSTKRIHRIADMSEGETKQRLQSLVKTIVQSDSYYDVFKNLKTYKDISLMQSLLSDAGVASVPRTSYLSAFNKMDKTAMYNAEKGFDLACHSFPVVP